MKALLCTRFGTPDDLELARHPRSRRRARAKRWCGSKAAALNFFDTLIIAGKYQTKPAMPFSPAAEFAGTVESVGDGVTSLKAGDRVLGYMRLWRGAREASRSPPTGWSRCRTASTSIAPPASASPMARRFMR